MSAQDTNTPPRLQEQVLAAENAPSMSVPPPSRSASDPPPSRVDLAVIEDLRIYMWFSHFVEEKTALDAVGNLLVEGVVRASWDHCLKIDGLDWTYLSSDLSAVLLDHVHDVYDISQCSFSNLKQKMAFCWGSDISLLLTVKTKCGYIVRRRQWYSGIEAASSPLSS